jgi:hypothetical protein
MFVHHGSEDYAIPFPCFFSYASVGTAAVATVSGFRLFLEPWLSA